MNCESPDVGAELESRRLNMFHNFHVLQTDMVFGINKFLFVNKRNVAFLVNLLCFLYG